MSPILIDLLALAALIQKTALLTAPERAYWSARLSLMTNEQLTKLDGILKEAEHLTWTKRAVNFVASLGVHHVPVHA